MGRLSVVGTGVRAGLQLTPEARQEIVSADEVFYLVTDMIAGQLIQAINPAIRSLAELYSSTKLRQQTYEEMISAIMESVRSGNDVCVAFYGHPGVYAYPAHEAVRQARKEGFDATMLPGVSALDCLYADLGLDPGENGCQSYHANDFLLHSRTFDPNTPLILLQIVATGQLTNPVEIDRNAVAVLADVLIESYGPDHEVVLYVAPMFPIGKPFVLTASLADLPNAEIPHLATLYVPPLSTSPIDPAMAERLGLNPRTLVRESASFTAPT